jgi:hypothetical protein
MVMATWSETSRFQTERLEDEDGDGGRARGPWKERHEVGMTFLSCRRVLVCYTAMGHTTCQRSVANV